MHSARQFCADARASLESMKRNGIDEGKQVRFMENLLLAVEAIAGKADAEKPQRKREPVPA